jgi:hypothetical protein
MMVLAVERVTKTVESELLAVRSLTTGTGMLKLVRGLVTGAVGGCMTGKTVVGSYSGCMTRTYYGLLH